jgi:predicted house-cleaning noncanonical NTP pyrophosphatase (MazG superfamily)
MRKKVISSHADYETNLISEMDMRNYNTETKTIPDRTVTVRLSEKDCMKLFERCGSSGITVSQLFESFIGDLIDGTYTNGSDERMLAGKWFDRCWFGMFPQKTLLNHLIECGYDPEEYFEMIIQLDTAIKETDYLNKHPEEKEAGDAEFFSKMISDCREEIKSMTDGWKMEEDTDLSEEIRRVASWIDEKNRFINGVESPITCREELEEIDLMEVLPELNSISKENDMEEYYTLSSW